MDNTLHVLVSKLLNCQDEQVSDKDTKLDVLAILANLVSTSPTAKTHKTDIFRAMMSSYRISATTNV